MYNLLADILSSFLGDNRGHNEELGQIKFDCPACSADKDMPEGDGKGNLEINYNRGVFKCWSCMDTNNMHGHITKLIKRYGTPKILRDYLLIRPESGNVVLKEHKDVIIELPKEYKKLSNCTRNDYKSDIALNYLHERGITNEIIEEFNIGYANNGQYFNRIIIPSYDSENKLNYFVARWFSKEKNPVKYLNPEGTKKQEIIFNENKLNLDATIYLVEGPMDHLVVPNSVPILGKAIPPILLDLLHDRATCNIIIILDDDAYEDAKNLYKQLNFGNLRNRIKISRPPTNHDPSSIYQTLGNKGIIKLLKGAHALSESELY